MHTKLAFRSAVETGKLIKQGKLSSEKVTRTLLERIDKFDRSLGSYASLLAQAAVRQARQADREVRAGKIRSPIHGVPLAVKDLCDIRGLPTTGGIPAFEDRIAETDSTVVRKLRDAGAVIIGKLHLTEAALGLHHPNVNPPVNPWNKTRWSGASSSGTGVSVAAGLNFGALGSDTGGSIRFPAAANGVVGLKPTWGRVSRHGVFPLSETLDHVGPLTRSVEDAAAILQAIAGVDPKDVTAAHEEVPDYLTELTKGVRGLTIGVDRVSTLAKVDPEIRRAVEKAIRVFKTAGAKIRPCKIPNSDAVVRAWIPICASEAAAAHNDTFPRRIKDYSDSLQNFLTSGQNVPATELANANIERARYRANMNNFFGTVDLLIKPVTKSLNPTIKGLNNLLSKADGIEQLVNFTCPDDLTGMPTITLPAGLDKNGSPIAFQLVASAFQENLLFRAGKVWQSKADWRKILPPLAVDE